MKILILIIMLCGLLACKTGREAPSQDQHTAAPQITGKTQSTPVKATDKNTILFVASGFEPMWHLELSLTADSVYLITYTNITGEMTGKLRKVTAQVFEGTIQSGTKKGFFKLVISNKPCMHEDGATRDPQTATITFENNTSSGCGKFLKPG